MKFDEMGLDPKILDAVNDVGYTEPTPIQAQAIPVILQGDDVLGTAHTGTGKTAGFTLPMIQRLMKGRAKARMPRTLILEPTRELAAQVAENFELYGKNTKLTKALLIGGVSFGDQEKAIMRGADVLIATPGRLLDHVERGGVLLRGVEILVIDEADRMLDMGFIPDIEKIVKLLPFTRQTLFFSATMPPEITKLADKFLSSPKRIEVASATSANTAVTHKLVPTTRDEKQKSLRELLNRDNVKNGIIFCNRKKDISVLNGSMVKHGYATVCLHGDMDQYTRMDMLERFKSGGAKFLIASDVAARGLDIPDVSHVFNFDVPTHAEDYIHRIGRTGRAGKLGQAYTLFTPQDAKYVEAIEKMLETKIDIEETTVSHQKPTSKEAKSAHPKPNKRRGLIGRARKETKAKPETKTEIKPETKTEVKPEVKPEVKSPSPAPASPLKSEPKSEKVQPPAQSTPSQSGPKPKPKGFGDNVPAFMQNTLNK